MVKSKKKFLLTSLALAVPLVATIASACSEIGSITPTPKIEKENQETQKGTKTLETKTSPKTTETKPKTQTSPKTTETKPKTQTSPKTTETKPKTQTSPKVPGPRIKSRDFLEWFGQTPQTYQWPTGTRSRDFLEWFGQTPQTQTSPKTTETKPKTQTRQA